MTQHLWRDHKQLFPTCPHDLRISLKPWEEWETRRGFWGHFFSIDKGPSPTQLCRNRASGACPAFYTSTKFSSSNFSKKKFQCGAFTMLFWEHNRQSFVHFRTEILKLSAFSVGMAYFVLVLYLLPWSRQKSRYTKHQDVFRVRVIPLFHSLCGIFIPLKIKNEW